MVIISTPWDSLPLPFLPAAFQSPNLGEAHFHQLLRHPGAGALVRSGAVKDDFLPFRQGRGPGFDIMGVLAHRALDFFIAALPILRPPHIQDEYLGVGEPAFLGFRGPDGACGASWPVVWPMPPAQAGRQHQADRHQQQP